MSRFRIPQTTKWIPVLEVAFFLIAFAAGVAFGAVGLHSPYAPSTLARPLIRPDATSQQVAANFTGRPFVVAGQLSELPGFLCNAWTDSGRDWVALECIK
jgi:hypothetical protein